MSSLTDSRRRFLAGGLAAGVLATTGTARAIGDGSKLEITQLRHNGNWDTRPLAGLSLAQHVRRRTSIDVRLERMVVEASDPRLFYHPMLLLLGDNRFRFSDKARTRLEQWIQAGGFLLIDNNGRSEPSGGFDSAVRHELATMFPGRPMRRIPPEHVIFRTFYKLAFPWGRAIRRPHVEGLVIDGRIAALYTQNDLMGALDRDKLGEHRFDVSPNEKTREQAIRFAINIVNYAMCLDYKDDQVHLDFLLHRRKWRIKPPTLETP